MLLITAVAVAQLVESWIVIPVVVGSSPIGHPKIPLLSPVVTTSFVNEIPDLSICSLRR